MRKQGLAHLYAIGRKHRSTANGTESAYGQHLQMQSLAGEVIWYAFQRIKLRLAPDTHLTIDYAVMRADGVLRMIDVKGAKHLVTDDARVKMKIAADAFPFVFEIVYPIGGAKARQWVHEEIGG